MTALNVLSEQWVSHLWAVSWQVSILFAIIWIIEKLSFRASSLFRYWLWVIVLIRLCIPVNLAVPGGLGQLIMENIAPQRPIIQNILVKDNIPSESEMPVNASITNSEVDRGYFTLEHVKSTFSKSPSGIAGIIWLVSICLISAVIMFRILWIKRRIKNLKPIERADLIALFRHHKEKFGFTQSIQLVEMHNIKIDVPSVIGVLHPKIFLPRSISENWPIEDIEPILLHELAHIKRRDHIVNFLQVIIQAVYFFHPVVWFVNQRIRNLREQLSDDLAIHKLGQENSRYSKSILRVMENIAINPAYGVIGIGFSELNSFTGERIKRVMDTNYINKTKMTSFSIFMVIIIGTAGLFVSCGQPKIIRQVVKPPTEEFIFTKEIIIENIMTEEKQESVASAFDNNGGQGLYFPVATVKGADLEPPEELNSAIENVAATVTRHSALSSAIIKDISLDTPGFSNVPMIFMSADKGFKLTPNEAKNLGEYLRNGGFAFIDNGTPEFEFGDAEASLRQALRDALQSDAKFLPIPNSHPIYHVFADFENGPPLGSESISNPVTISKKILFLEGLWLDGKLVAVYSDKDYIKKWAENNIHSSQMQMGVNLIIFAALQKVEKIIKVLETPNVVKTPTVVKIPTTEYIVRKPGGSEDNASLKSDHIVIEIHGKGQYTIDGMHLDKNTFDVYFLQEYAAIGDSLQILLQADIQNDLDDIFFIMKTLKSRKHSVEMDMTSNKTNELKRAKLSLRDGDKPLYVDGKIIDGSDVLVIDYGSDARHFFRIILE
ncbi:M56 family metallopeptidase [Candidatus Latescibacterota bacterium]